MTAPAPTLDIRGLTLDFHTRRGVLRGLDDVSLSIAPGEILGVVGESGAGKSMTGNAVMGLVPESARLAAGEIRLSSERIDQLPERAMRRLRGRRIGMIFQDPLTSLDPLMTVGAQLIESVRSCLGVGESEARRRALALLHEVGIPAAGERLDSYPHEFSGGMRQRVVIALALAGEPDLLIADEPTTALDVSVQAQIVDLFRRLCRERATAAMLITHDMGVIAEAADRVAVMYAGRVVEIGPVADIIARPQHPYSQGLMASIPGIGSGRRKIFQIPGTMPRLSALPDGCAFHPRCPFAADACRTTRPELAPREGTDDAAVACLRAAEIPAGVPAPATIAADGTRAESTGRTAVEVDRLGRTFDVSANPLERILTRTARRYLHAVDDVSFRIGKGRTLALVGESGSGKSTLAKMMVGLLSPSHGAARFDGETITSAAASARSDLRRRIQMVFQDPYASLNPRWRVGRIISEPLRVLDPATPAATRTARAEELLGLVGLSPEDAVKYPHEFSGGQRQRIAIARALSTEPELIVFDEPTSALDVSVQAQLLNLIRDLQDRLGLTYLLISHDLSVVANMADEVAVLYLGRLVEIGPAADVLAAPRHPYTRLLLDGVPRLDGTGRDRRPPQGEMPNPIDPPAGCAFHTRCPLVAPRCKAERPRLLAGVACHAVEEGRAPSPTRQGSLDA